MLAACLDLILRSLGQVRSELLHLQQEMVGLLNAERIAHELNDARLLRVISCAKHNVEQEAANLGTGLASIGHLLGLVELFGKLAGRDLATPNMGDLAGRPLDQAVAPIDTMIGALGALRSSLALVAPQGGRA
jgi:hypothetical protein